MKKRGIFFCLLASCLSSSLFAAIDLSPQYSQLVAALTESGSKDCGETAADDRGTAGSQEVMCAWQAFREKKPFTVTRKLAVSGERRAEWNTFIGRSNGQVFRLMYRADACGNARGEQPGCGPRLEVAPCLLESSALSGRLNCARPQNPWVRPEQTSTDPEYGYSVKKPIMLGEGPSASRWYLWHLWDDDLKPFTYERLGSLAPGRGPDKHILDEYVITDSRGNESVIYIDMYHPEMPPIKGKAPKGIFLWW